MITWLGLAIGGVVAWLVFIIALAFSSVPLHYNNYDREDQKDDH